MTRRQQLSLVLGCALVLWLEGPHAWRVLAADLERATLAGPAPALLARARPPLVETTELASVALASATLASVALYGPPLPPPLSAHAAPTGPAPR